MSRGDVRLLSPPVRATLALHVSEIVRAQAFEAQLARANVWLLLVYEVAAFIAAAFLHVAKVPSPWKELGAVLLTFGAAALWAVRALPAGDFSLRELAGSLPRRSAWRLVLVVVFNNLTLSVGLFGLSRLTGVPLVEARDLGPSAAEASSEGRALFLVLVAVIAAPFVEELVFRGILFRKLRFQRGGGAALVLTSALFAVLHPGRQLNMAILGIQLVLLYTSTRTLWAPVLAHLINNSVGVAVLLASSSAALAPENPAPSVTWISLGLGAAGLAWFVQQTRHTLRDPLPPFERSEPVLEPPGRSATIED
jgi:CAAX protease family protein